jgi:hypothetical protein
MLALVYFYKNNKAYNRFHFCSYFIIFQFKTQNHNLSWDVHSEKISYQC